MIDRLVMYEQGPTFMGTAPSYEYSPDRYKELRNTHNSLVKLRKEYPIVTRVVEDVALWFIPYVGPYLVAIRGTLDGISSIKNGDYTTGIIQVLTSPLSFARYARFASIFKLDPNIIKILKGIHKSGITVLTSKGKEQFFKWGVNTYGNDFVRFMDLLKNKERLKQILVNIVKLK